MVNRADPTVKFISLSELDAVVEQAAADGWQDLTLVGPDGAPTNEALEHTFYLRESLRGPPPRLAALPALTSLNLRSNGLEHAGIRALAALSGLTSLNLSDNRIDDAGASELTALTSLMSLDLGNNQIGADGATALAALGGLTSLDLRGNRIDDAGASALSALTGLSSLDLGNNQIGAAGARVLAQLAGLTSLDISRNRLRDADVRALTPLTQLTCLRLSGNQLGPEGASALTGFPALTHLDLSANRLGDHGAHVLAKLAGLTSLHLQDNQIGPEGARALATVTRLTHLNLDYNRISDAGACALVELSGLSSLSLIGNEIGDDGARALATLTGLTDLDLNYNRIGVAGARSLLDAWCDICASSRRRINLRNNKDLRSLAPLGDLEAQDSQSILAAYRRYREAQRLDALWPLNEAKLVVVGNEAVGKTSLIKYLMHDTPRNPDEQRTQGAEIHEKIEVSKWSVHHSQVLLNVWDFGGQEILRGTHRFFLTERSLYLLVLEDRREDDRSIYDWLELIAQRCGDSPAIIVVNKTDSDMPQRLLDETGLRREYPVIEGFARTSCNAGAFAAASIARLRTMIATTLSESPRLKHVRDPVPQSWLRVKDAIPKLARDSSVLTMRDFERLCEGDATNRSPDPVTDPDEQRAILTLLHDLGVVVAHGARRDASAVRRETAILDPNWLTGAFYALINSPTVRDQKGELRHDQLGTLLDPARHPARWHELILNMMQEPELSLCLPIERGNSPRYLLPDALPPNEPDYDMWPDKALRFRFKYKRLPTEFIPRFIIEAHHSLTDKPTWWRTGVILGAEDCYILVRGDTANDRVEIYVDGPDDRRRAALSIVRNYFNAVHRYYAKPRFEARVPFPDQPEEDIGYDYLLELEHDEGLDHSFRPEKAKRKYSVGELLEGVRDKAKGRGLYRNDYAFTPLHVDADPDDTPMVSRPPRLPATSYLDKVDFGILTILPKENDAVLRRFAIVATEDGRQQRYRIRRLALPSGGAYTLAVLQCLRDGTTDAHAAANALLEDLAPRFVFVVGIAGGVPSAEFSLGDVVVSSRIVDFSVEAVIRGKEREYALDGGPLAPDASRLVADISAMVTDGELGDWNSLDAITRPQPPVDLADHRFYGDQAWQASVRQHMNRHFGHGRPRPPRVITGAIASSDRLIKDDETLANWLRHARHIKAVEMESAGIYKATHGRGVPFLAIRGISDVVGFERDHDWDEYACETAAAFVRALLLTQPIKPIARR